MTKTIFITGATAGIGVAATRRFAKAGWNIVATGRRGERLDALVAELGADTVHPIVLDMTDVFTPGGRYRAAMTIKGRETLVRRPDGIHLNDAGARVALDIVLARLRADFAKLG